MTHSWLTARAAKSAAVLLLIGFAVAACGSSKDKSSSTSSTSGGASTTSSTATTSSTTAAGGGGAGAPTGEPIRIGYVCSCTGPLASTIKLNRDAYEAWVKSVNDAGGIDGHEVQLFTADDQTNPGTSVSEVRKLVEQHHVIAVVSVSNSPTAFADYLTQKHIPVIGSDGATSEMFTNPGWFYPGQTADSIPASIAIGAKKAGAKKYAIFYCAESPACQELVKPEKQASKKYGIDLAYISQISASAPNYTAQCIAAKQAGATVLFIADALTVVESVAKSCDQQGYNPTVLADDGAVAAPFKDLPGLSDGLLAVQPQIPFSVTNTPGTRAMVKAFNKYKPGLVKDENYNGEVVQAWASGLLLEAAAKAGHAGAHGTPTSQELFSGLYALKDETLGGMTPPLNYKEGVGHSIPCWFWMGTKDGKFTQPYGSKPQCVKGSSGSSGAS